LLIVSAGLLSSVAFTYRYAGITLLALPVLVICVGSWRDGFSAILKRTLAYLAVASVLPALVVARNLSEGSPALGARASSIETLGGVTRGVGATWRDWILGGSGLSSKLGDLALVGAAALVIVGFVVAFQKHGFRIGPPRATPLLPMAAFVVGYLLYIFSSELLANIDPVNGRLLSPIFAPTAVLVAVALESIFALDGVASRRWLVGGLAAILVLWLSLSLAESANRARKQGDSGQGYAARSWVDSDLVAAVRTLPPMARIYSNVAGGLYYATARQPVFGSPARVFYRSNDKAHELATFRRHVRRSPRDIYLVWRGPPNAHGYRLTPVELRRDGVRLTRVAQTRDGAVYQVTG
jgi:hypothetical protein